MAYASQLKQNKVMVNQLIINGDQSLFLSLPGPNVELLSHNRIVPMQYACAIVHTCTSCAKVQSGVKPSMKFAPFRQSGMEDQYQGMEFMASHFSL